MLTVLFNPSVITFFRPNNNVGHPNFYSRSVQNQLLSLIFNTQITIIIYLFLNSQTCHHSKSRRDWLEIGFLIKSGPGKSTALEFLKK